MKRKINTKIVELTSSAYLNEDLFISDYECYGLLITVDTKEGQLGLAMELPSTARPKEIYPVREGVYTIVNAINKELDIDLITTEEVYKCIDFDIENYKQTPRNVRPTPLTDIQRFQKAMEEDWRPEKIDKNKELFILKAKEKIKEENITLKDTSDENLIKLIKVMGRHGTFKRALNRLFLKNQPN